MVLFHNMLILILILINILLTINMHTLMNMKNCLKRVSQMQTNTLFMLIVLH